MTVSPWTDKWMWVFDRYLAVCVPACQHIWTCIGRPTPLDQTEATYGGYKRTYAHNVRFISRRTAMYWFWHLDRTGLLPWFNKYRYRLCAGLGFNWWYGHRGTLTIACAHLTHFVHNTDQYSVIKHAPCLLHIHDVGVVLYRKLQQRFRTLIFIDSFSFSLSSTYRPLSLIFPLLPVTPLSSHLLILPLLSFHPRNRRFNLHLVHQSSFYPSLSSSLRPSVTSAFARSFPLSFSLISPFFCSSHRSSRRPLIYSASSSRLLYSLNLHSPSLHSLSPYALVSLSLHLTLEIEYPHQFPKRFGAEVPA